MCEPQWSWDTRRQPFADYDLWYVYAGRGTMHLSDTAVELSPGVIFCLRPDSRHFATHDPAHRLGVCYQHFDFIDARGRRRRPAPRELPPVISRLDDSDFHERLLRRAVEGASSSDAHVRESAELHLLAAMAAMRAQASRPETDPEERRRRERIESAARRIRENPAEPVTVTEMAEAAGYSDDHFTRLFSRFLGATPKEYAIRARLQRARQLLQHSALTVEQIAFTLGYADVFFFSRQFKQRFGVPPTSLRKG